ncbi:uncharacterized protein F4812DRAFT_422588 [Daldinia caldariorum]|uniref:uncharacterized protein n=1 Tax=Daldinia caldariorum TaxID=326644 RepID=UPI0020085AC5|nr:uncharacterized protein F4812DRAFT_422588 [Daldinia caldariorum]KAI1469277.1 hypothetical protein F4812DRAFT_422588 [Daldinia caldariorum]
MAALSSSLFPPDQPFRRHAPRPCPEPIRWRSRQELQQSYKRSSRHDQVSRSIRVHRFHGSRVVRQRRPRSSYLAWGFDDEDNRRLAADPNVKLPSDFSRFKPRLERQEAFREPKTAQGFYSDVVEDDSDLYKLGLLYDDEHTRGSYFSLDAIVHDEPIYSVRPAKRARKQRQEKSHFPLDLSYALINRDVDVGPFLAPEVHEIPVPVEDISAPQDKPKHIPAPAQSYMDAKLPVIHELPESSSPSFRTAAPEATDFPDLISDSEVDAEDEELHGDWALLDDADILSNADADVSAEDIVDATSVAGEVWVVLGDGS